MYLRKADRIFLTKGAVIGNALFALWLLYNAIDSGFSGTLPQIMSYVGLIVLLAVNTYLITSQESQVRKTLKTPKK